MEINVHIGSRNPAKVSAVESVFSKEQGFVVHDMDIPSNVSPQPISDEETKQGAMNRAKYLVTECDASIGIGLEGGVVDEGDTMMICNWGALATKDGNLFVAGGARFPLPDSIANEIRNGKELGEVIDQWANKRDIRKNEGTVGVLTAGIVTRSKMFSHVAQLLYGQWQFQKNKKRQ
ncbi:DUF84 family protein [Alteribacter populi]|uniref:DUF84 family protein n=1 Tax=Alteribacter populi TaxID=2011011 RepID=UPI000BBA988E|nr:DUF84 family protein [Alteribacter populi]